MRTPGRVAIASTAARTLRGPEARFALLARDVDLEQDRQGVAPGGTTAAEAAGELHAVDRVHQRRPRQHVCRLAALQVADHVPLGRPVSEPLACPQEPLPPPQPSARPLRPGSRRRRASPRRTPRPPLRRVRLADRDQGHLRPSRPARLLCRGDPLLHVARCCCAVSVRPHHARSIWMMHHHA